MLLAAGRLLIVAWCEKAEPLLGEPLGGGDSLGDRGGESAVGGTTEREPSQHARRKTEGAQITKGEIRSGRMTNEGMESTQFYLFPPYPPIKAAGSPESCHHWVERFR